MFTAVKGIVESVFDKISENTLAEQKNRLAEITAKAEARAQERHHEVRLAKIEDVQLARRESTIRWIAPVGVIGVIGIIVYALAIGKIGDAVSGIMAMAMVFAFLNRLIDGRSRRKKQHDESEGADDKPSPPKLES